MKVFCAAAIGAAAALCALSGCMTPLDREPVLVAERVQNVEGVDWIARDGKYIFASRVSAEALRRMANEDLTAVINLMTEEELLALDYNEPALARDLGLAYHSLPVTIDSFSVNDVSRLAELYADKRYATMLQSPSADRAGMVWGAYLARERGYSLEEAEIRARAAGLSSEAAAEAMRRVATEGRDAP